MYDKYSVLLSLKSFFAISKPILGLWMLFNSSKVKLLTLGSSRRSSASLTKLLVGTTLLSSSRICMISGFFVCIAVFKAELSSIFGFR